MQYYLLTILSVGTARQQTAGNQRFEGGQLACHQVVTQRIRLPDPTVRIPQSEPLPGLKPVISGMQAGTRPVPHHPALIGGRQTKPFKDAALLL